MTRDERRIGQLCMTRDERRISQLCNRLNGLFSFRQQRSIESEERKVIFLLYPPRSNSRSLIPAILFMLLVDLSSEPTGGYSGIRDNIDLGFVVPFNFVNAVRTNRVHNPEPVFRILSDPRGGRRLWLTHGKSSLPSGSVKNNPKFPQNLTVIRYSLGL